MALLGDDWRAVAVCGVLLLAVAVMLLSSRAARRRERQVGRWRNDHARRLPWALFLRRRTPLRLVDGRSPVPDAGPDRPSA